MSSHASIIKERVSIIDCVSPYVRLQERAGRLIGLCPFHKEKTPSFTLSGDKKHYHCFGCGAKGDAINFLMDIQKKSFQEVIHDLCELLNIPINERGADVVEKEAIFYDIYEAACVFYEKNLKLSHDGLSYLEERDIKTETISYFRLGFSDEKGGLYYYLKLQKFLDKDLAKSGLFLNNNVDCFRGRLQFPIRDIKGRVIAFGGRILNASKYKNAPKYLNSPQTSIFEKKQVLFGLFESKDCLRHNPPVVVEGFFDVIRLHQNGIRHAVAPLGTALTPHHLEKLWAYHHSPTFCFDGDAAGQNASIKAAHMILETLNSKKTGTFCFLPNGQDPDSFAKNHSFLEFLQNPKDLFSTIFDHAISSKGALQSKSIEEQTRILDEMIHTFETIPDSILKDRFKKQAVYAFKTALYKKKNTKNSLHSFKKENQENTREHDVHVDLPSTEKKMLGFLLKRPYLLSKVFDDVARTHFCDASLESLRQKILECYLVGSEKDVTTFLTTSIDAKKIIESKEICIDAFDDYIIIDMWKNYANRLSILDDFKKTFMHYKSNPNPHQWKRIVALRKMEITR